MTKKENKKTFKDIKRSPLFFSIETSKLEFDENGAPKEIQVLMCGEWNHPVYGPIIIKTSDITEFKNNFDAGLRRDIPITEGHESFDEKPAVGWFTELIDKGQDGLYATTEWTPKGKTLLAEKAYKYFSPEFYTEYEDPETREIYRDVLVGGALTNKPYFKKMSAVVLSEKSINSNYIFSDMNIKEITAKKVEELTAEEIAFLKENKSELSTEELATFGSILEDGAGDDKGEDKGDDKGAEDKGEDKGDDTSKGDGEDKGDGASDKADMSEVKMSRAEFKALSEMANKGAKAFAELRNEKVKNEAKQLTFSEQNSKGKVMPKDEAKVFNFMLGLTDAQRKTFGEIVEAIPSSNLFNERGSSAMADGTASVEITKRTEKMMSEDKGLSYSDALKKVIASDKDLAKRYEQELK